MKKIFVMLFVCVIFGSIVFTGCSKSNQDNISETTEATEATEANVADKDIEEKIIGSWILIERNGQPALTNEKGVFTFLSPTKAYISVSFNALPEVGEQWINKQESDVNITGNKVATTRLLNNGTSVVDELTISEVNDIETQGRLLVKSVKDGKETIITEEDIRLVKINEDYSKDILGTWEGRCTSEGSEFDDGQVHRWEYKDDGSYVYYEKAGDNWVPGDDTMNEYFVAGNLLCTRWVEGDTEFREWWEISIDGDTMNWTALRKDEDGKTFTVEFEMTRVEQ